MEFASGTKFNRIEHSKTSHTICTLSRQHTSARWPDIMRPNAAPALLLLPKLRFRDAAPLQRNVAHWVTCAAAASLNAHSIVYT